jgi:uncharacterized SAM-binding protein YcdF (DUF218 family)
LLLVVAAGVALLYAGSTVARWARRWLVAVVAGYWILSCPAGAAMLARTVTADHRPLATADAAAGAQAVVLLSGGSRTIRAAGGRLPVVTTPSAMRALETARVYALLGDPLVIVSGGVTESRGVSEADAIRAAVVALGVPAHRVVLESESRNTHEEAIALKRMLAERHIDRFVIVTSAIHMGRSLAAFAAEGLHPVPSAAPLYQDRADAPFALTPNEVSMEIGNAVVYEWGARAYYWWRGWI